MEYSRKFFAATFLVAVLSVPMIVNAALVSRLGGTMVYDTDLDITWLADANLATSEAFGVLGITGAGSMTWYKTQDWIGGMNASNYLGFNNWRAPATSDPDITCSNQSPGSFGYNCTGSEMGYLFYNLLGGIQDNSILTVHNESLGLFSNIQPYYYWSTGNDYFTPATAWDFSFGTGIQGAGDRRSDTIFAWAVHDGDIGAVPLPAAVWLFGSGLVGLIGLARHKNI